MTLLNTINVGGTDYGITGAAVLGSCATPAGSEIKVCAFSDNFQLKAGDMLLVKFTYANTYGDGSTTYPKLQVNGTNYIMRRADGNYLQSGEWGNNATLTFLFDGTDFILPAGSGSGNTGGVPLGTILAIHSNQVPDGYLPCNGVQFDTAQFAALYALLGDDHTPDLREVTLRGIGHNGTYVFDSTETNPNTGVAGTQNHDEYTLGEFKDDQLQNINGELIFGTAGINTYGNVVSNSGAFTVLDSVPRGITGIGTTSNTGSRIGFSAALVARTGTVTRGKSVGVNYIIKATSGLPESQQDYILNTINTQRSYSTTEQTTGKTWTDGKPIYRKVVDCGTLPNNAETFTDLSIQNLATVVSLKGMANNGAGTFLPLPYMDASLSNCVQMSVANNKISIITNGNRSSFSAVAIVEYTKTTPST